MVFTKGLLRMCSSRVTIARPSARAVAAGSPGTEFVPWVGEEAISENPMSQSRSRGYPCRSINSLTWNRLPNGLYQGAFANVFVPSEERHSLGAGGGSK